MDNFKATVQVEKRHYDFVQGSFINLYNQINDVVALVKKNEIINPKILVIGVGDNLLKIILKNKFNLTVKTMDIDIELEPGYLGSITDIRSIVTEKFDIVICAHVLEHLPFKYFSESINQIKLISDYSLVYLPIAKFGIIIGAGIYPFFFKKIYLIATWFFKKHKFDGQHYWEIGTFGYPATRIRRELNKYFYIKKEYNPENWMYSYNFILKSKR